MTYGSLDDFLGRGRATLARGPVALIGAEDLAEVASTLDHHLARGFRSVVLLAPAWVQEGTEVPDGVVQVIHDVRTAPGGLAGAVSRALAAAEPGTWVYAGYNAEYLFYPCCETRTVGEMLAFHAEERRMGLPCVTVDLYPDDLDRAPDGVARANAWLDGAGYYSLPEKDPANGWAPLDRQVEIHGGLRWRMEPHIPWERRRLDRIALVRADRGLSLTPDWRVAGDAERNTLNCPWHRNLTGAVASFRVAKALATNPASRDRIAGFMGPMSVRFDWSSQQLLDLGFMEPGQWF
ncbi:MAG: hypothetical protein MUF73_07360 [Rhodobacteraceae bacterium]|jgi:hypothetical protein|nr:hypothetical protein [Paracoccaceae bacterium]